jgi:hypothetical protein
MPVILTTWEVEIGRIVVQGLPRQNNLWDSSSKITRAKCTCFISTKPWVQIPVPTSPQKSSYLSEMLCIFFFFLAVLGVWIHGLVPDRNSTIWTTPLVLFDRWVCFSDRASHFFAQAGFEPWSSYQFLLHSWDYEHMPPHMVCFVEMLNFSKFFAQADRELLPISTSW